MQILVFQHHSDQFLQESEEKKRLHEDESAAKWQWREAEVAADLAGMENGLPEPRQLKTKRKRWCNPA